MNGGFSNVYDECCADGSHKYFELWWYIRHHMVSVVFDSNVLVAGLCSSSGASNALLELLPSVHFQLALSVPLYAEYQDVLLRRDVKPHGITDKQMQEFLRYIAGVSSHHAIYFLWRPFLRDPKDDMVLELAVAARCKFIVTHNLNDFAGAEQFGLHVVTPTIFYELIQVRKR
jgi:putative PIN family toxin of toxin-antitoxin system